MKEEVSKKDSYERALNAYGEAIKEYRKGNWEKAQSLFESFILKFNEEKELVDRAQIYLKIIKEKGKRGLGLPKTNDDYYYFSVFRLNQGQYEEALKLLNKALEFKSDEGKVYYLMAQIYCLQGQNDEALECLKKAIQKDKIYKVMAQNEADFAPLWEDKKFKLLTKLI
ncbi:MAG: tetratricopeptide repeat protein [Candidatus Aminicenantes bacterium]|nr:tetratricopeptide repeat protein [Candidatus Aminicenantes bacterium]